MKAIILSAGQGSRLGALTHDRPKCLIPFAGRSLLDRQLDTLAANGDDQQKLGHQRLPAPADFSAISKAARS